MLYCIFDVYVESICQDVFKICSSWFWDRFYQSYHWDRYYDLGVAILDRANKLNKLVDGVDLTVSPDFNMSKIITDG